MGMCSERGCHGSFTDGIPWLRDLTLILLSKCHLVTPPTLLFPFKFLRICSPSSLGLCPCCPMSLEGSSSNLLARLTTSHLTGLRARSSQEVATFHPQGTACLTVEALAYSCLRRGFISICFFTEPSAFGRRSDTRFALYLLSKKNKQRNTHGVRKLKLFQW